MEKRAFCTGAHSNLFKYSCGSPKTILVIVQNIPMPTQIGIDKRAFHIIELLIALGHDVHYTPLFERTGAPTVDDKKLQSLLQAKAYETPIFYKGGYKKIYR